MTSQLEGGVLQSWYNVVIFTLLIIQEFKHEIKPLGQVRILWDVVLASVAKSWQQYPTHQHPTQVNLKLTSLPQLTMATPLPATTSTATATATVTATSGADGFPFPREYHFPPFFTPQTNLTTRHAQLTKWTALVLAYARYQRLFKISADNEIFCNKRIDRRLAPSEIRDLFAFMCKDGKAEHDAGASDVVYLYWRRPEEWAALVEKYVDETGQKGAVLTLWELSEGEGTRGTGKFITWREGGRVCVDLADGVRFAWHRLDCAAQGAQRASEEGQGADLRVRGLVGRQILLKVIKSCYKATYATPTADAVQVHPWHHLLNRSIRNLSSNRTCCAMATSRSQSGATMRGSMLPFSAISLNRDHSCFSSALLLVRRYTGSGGA